MVCGVGEIHLEMAQPTKKEKKYETDLGRMSSKGSKTIHSLAVWPYLAIYWTLDNFLKPLTTINLPKSSTFLGNFCKGVKIYHFSSEIIFVQLW